MSLFDEIQNDILSSASLSTVIEGIASAAGMVAALEKAVELAQQFF